jgi:hypothetical protein
MFKVGSDVIRTGDSSLNEDQLEAICVIILEVAKTNQSDEGIAKNVLYDDLGSEGYSRSVVKEGINHLLITGQLRQVGINHYIAEL